MPRRQTPWSPQRGDWRLSLSWPGTPVTSFRWGRVVTINAGPEARPALLSSGCNPLSPSCHASRANSRPWDPSPAHPTPTRHSLRTDNRPGARHGRAPSPPVTPCANSQPRGPSLAHPVLGLSLLAWEQLTPRVVENAPQAVSTALQLQPARFQVRPRASGHPHPTGHRNRRRHSTRPGACRPGLGHSTPAGTAIPSPNAQDVPAQAPEAARQAPTDQGWTAPIPAALRARRGPPGAPGYGHRPAPARCAGGP